MNVWMDKGTMRSTHAYPTAEYDLSLKKNEACHFQQHGQTVRAFAKWNVKQRKITHDLTYMWNLKKLIHRSTVEQWLPEAGRWGERKILIKGYRVISCVGWINSKALMCSMVTS